MADALADSEQRRNERAFPLYELTIHTISFRPVPPEQVMLYKALGGNQEDTDHMLGLLNGITPVQEFMARENVLRIIRQARRRAALA